MPIKFIEEEKTSDENLLLSMVENNQFFVSVFGQLCQKIDENAYQIIAQFTGQPQAACIPGKDADLVIKRILPKIIKIEF